MPTQIVVDISDPANQTAWGLLPIPGGTWVAGNYAAGTVASYQGALYYANKATSAVPAGSPDWTMLLAASSLTVVAWASGVPYTATPPASIVTYSGSTYICTTSHTSGATFDPSKFLAILSASGGALIEQAGWNAATNTPALASGVGTNGFFYVVTAAGATVLDGISTWRVGDIAWFSSIDGKWHRIAGPTFVSADITDSTAAGRALLTGADATAQRTALGLGSAALASTGAFLAATSNLSDLASPSAARANLGVRLPFPARQCVVSGPSSGGLPSFLPAISGALSITTTGLASVPLLLTSASGFDIYGQVNVTRSVNADVTWTLGANQTNYLMIDVNTGATGRTLAPIYQYGGPPSIVNAQYTFDFHTMQGYIGNGTTAIPVNYVFVGEAVTNATSVTSTVAYAYGGRFFSGWQTPLPTTAGQVNLNSNLGVAPWRQKLMLQCLTGEYGHAPGDIIVNGVTFNATVSGPLPLFSNRLQTILPIVSGTEWMVATAAGVAQALTPANWAWGALVERGW